MAIDTKEIERRVEEILGPALRDIDKEIVKVEYRREQVGWILRLYVDRLSEPGITVDELVEITKMVDPLLEVEEVIKLPYRLEVSSPGLDRPLVKPEDFERFSGRVAVITTLEGIVGRKRFKGTLKGREGDIILIEDEKVVYRIPWGLVKKANLKEDLMGAKRHGEY